MPVEPTIALVFSPEPWVERLHRHLTDHGGARVRQVVLDPALALEDDYDALVVSHRWPGLTRPFVDSVHRAGRGVLGVFDPDEPGGQEHLTALEVDAAIPADAPIADFVDSIARLAPKRTAASSVSVADASALRDDASAPRGPIVVTGAGGSGVTEVALGLTVALAARGERAVLVDADESGSCTAARLGLAIEPNLRSAVDAVEYGLGALGTTLHGVGSRAEVLCGFPSAASVAQVRPHDVLDVVGALAASERRVVVEVSGRRGAEIAAAVIATARTLVAVSIASPVGVVRLLGWLAEIARPVASLHVVLNRAPTDKYRQAELTAEVYRTISPTSLTYIPHDRRVERAAWSGELAGHGPFTSNIAALAQTAVPCDARSSRATRRSRRTRRAA
jgi:MinD-like ATPase involved in chromosome partitioning or flagellar assembly